MSSMESAFRTPSQETPQERPASPSEKKRRKPRLKLVLEDQVERRADEQVATEEALANIREQLDADRSADQRPLDHLTIGAESRARAIRADLVKHGAINPDRAWELIHEMHAFEFDLERAIDDHDSGSSTEPLLGALLAVRETLSKIRPMHENIPGRVAAENPDAPDAAHALWEDAREARQALAERKLSLEDASRLKTIFIERAQRLEDEEKLLEEQAMDSGVRRHPQQQQMMVRALRELHAAIDVLGAFEREQAVDLTDEAAPIPPTIEDMQQAEIDKIVRQQRKLVSKIQTKYGKLPEELLAAGGPSGFKHWLGSLLSTEEQDRNDPYRKWKELEDQRQSLEAIRHPIVAEEEEKPIPLTRKKKKKAA